MADKRVDLALSEILGAARTTRQKITIYIPDSDQSGQRIDAFESWVERGQIVLTDLNGGATSYNVKGMWRHPDTGHTVQENTVIIYSYLQDAKSFLSKIGELVVFLHTFGIQTNQGEVLVEFDEYAYSIKDYEAGKLF